MKITDEMVEKAHYAMGTKLAQGGGHADIIRAALESVAADIRRAAFEKAAEAISAMARDSRDRANSLDKAKWNAVYLGLVEKAIFLEIAAAAIRTAATAPPATD